MSDDSKLPDLRYIRELAKVFKQYELDELEIETGDTRMLLRRSDFAPGTAAPSFVSPAAAVPTTAPLAATAPLHEERQEHEGAFITSPFVGTFYRSPRPDQSAFVEVGDKVQAGQTVCIVEAMKLFNEIEAEFACTIEEVLVESGGAVEFGTKLFRVRRS